MNDIVDFQLICNDDPIEFANKVMRQINEFQENGFSTEVQYSTGSIFTENKPYFSAFLTARLKD